MKYLDCRSLLSLAFLLSLSMSIFTFNVYAEDEPELFDQYLCIGGILTHFADEVSYNTAVDEGATVPVDGECVPVDSEEIVINLIDLSFSCSSVTGSLTYSANQPTYLFVTFNYELVKGVAFAGHVDAVGTVHLIDPYNTVGNIPHQIAVLAGPTENESVYIGGMNVDCSSSEPHTPIEIVSASAVCAGDVVVVTNQDAGRIGIELRPVNVGGDPIRFADSDGSSSYGFKFNTFSEEFFPAIYTIFLADTEEIIGTGELDIDCAEIPSTEPTPTPPPGEPETKLEIVIQLIGVEVAGQPFGVYAPSASTLPTGAYYTGEVNQDNAIVLSDIQPGHYKVIIAHSELGLFSFDISVEQTTQDVINLEIDLSGLSNPVVEDESRVSYTETHDTTESVAVSALPSTGIGSAPQVSIVGGSLLFIGMIIVMGGYRLKDRSA